MALVKATKANSNTNITEHFKLSEFACPHCGNVSIDKKLVESLEDFRTALNNEKTKISIHITSGYRCPIHNSDKSVGGAKNSRHLISDAADFNVGRVKNAIEVFKLATKYFKRCGLYESRGDKTHAYMHVDIAPEKSNLYWLSYYNGNKHQYKYFTTVDNLIEYAKQDKNHVWFKMVI
jgi:uncharacterized protein YcbK (DUF882 family)